MSIDSAPELEPMTKRDFKTVTTTKNKLVKAINNSQSDEAIIEYLVRELPKALEEYSSIVFELAGLENKIQAEPAFECLKKLDFEGLLTSNRIVDTQVKETRFISLLEELHRSNKDLVQTVQGLKEKPVPVLKPDQNVQATLVRVEKVYW